MSLSSTSSDCTNWHQANQHDAEMCARPSAHVLHARAPGPVRGQGGRGVAKHRRPPFGGQARHESESVTAKAPPSRATSPWRRTRRTVIGAVLLERPDRVCARSAVDFSFGLRIGPAVPVQNGDGCPSWGGSGAAREGIQVHGEDFRAQAARRTRRARRGFIRRSAPRADVMPGVRRATPGSFGRSLTRTLLRVGGAAARSP